MRWTFSIYISVVLLLAACGAGMNLPAMTELPPVTSGPSLPNDEAPIVVSASGGLVRQAIVMESEQPASAPPVTYFGIAN